MRIERLLALISLAVLLDASIAEANVSWNMGLFLAPRLWWTIPATLAIETPAVRMIERTSWRDAALLTLKLNLVSFLVGLFLFAPLPNILQMFSLVFLGNALIEVIAFRRWRPGKLNLRSIGILVLANFASTSLPFLHLALAK